MDFLEQALMKRLSQLTALSAYMLSACSNDVSSHSLVGGWNVQPDEVLAGETITLSFRKYGSDGINQTLAYTLRPGGVVEIERGKDRSVCCFGGIDGHTVDDTQRFQLTEQDQLEIRRLLGRLRPEKLSKEGPAAGPLGCAFEHDSGAWSNVYFERADVSGYFMYQNRCEGVGAEQVRSLLRSIIKRLPFVSGSSQFIRSA